jgi:beta-galactosidase
MTALRGVPAFLLLLWSSVASAAPTEVEIRRDDGGFQLLVDGEPTFLRGMNWGYVPIGTNYSYDFWSNDDAFIEAALREEMGLLRAMGGNSIRQYPGIPPKWVTWIYENYGISTMINPLVGRYGIAINGQFQPNADYSDPEFRAAAKAEALAAVEMYKDTAGVVVWLLGNENNYGLHWTGTEIQDLPDDATDPRAIPLYTLFGEIVDAIHAIDTHRPVAIANGDLQYIDLIAEHAPNLDIMSSNVYRGRSSRDLFAEVSEKLDIPFFYSEFGADAYDAKNRREDGVTQASYVLDLWEELYVQSHGKGRVGNAIGGYTFQWTDGWWKYLQETNLDVHDATASWSNKAYIEDWQPNANNMNEEWFGICAKGPPDESGRFHVLPRPAYYALRDAYKLDVYTAGLTIEQIEEHFDAIDPLLYESTYRADAAAAKVDEMSAAAVTNVRIEMMMTSSGGTARPAFGFPKDVTVDHMESLYVDLAVQPTDGLSAKASVNVLGNVASNRIDEIFYESRGRGLATSDALGEAINLSALERVRLYNMSFEWENPSFSLKGFYRTAHYHWGYEGDIFGLYREANYGPNLDIYDGIAPIGVEVHAHQALEGLSFAFGPQIFWGANPTVIGKYRRPLGATFVTVVHQEDLGQQASVDTSYAIPERTNRRSTIAVEYEKRGVGLTLGGIMAGTNRIGETYFEAVEADGGDSLGGTGYHVLSDEIRFSDTLGGRAKLTVEKGPIHAYAQGAYKGLVADGGYDPTVTFTGWSLKEDGRGNQMSGLAGVALNTGIIQLAPNVLYQKPLVGPLPALGDTYDSASGWYTPNVSPRNVLDDAFTVLGNRETTGLEMLIALDPTPATWMWMWDNDFREDASFAASVNFTYRIQPTSRDANFGFTEEGILFAFPGAPPAQDVWETKFRSIANPRGDFKILTNLWVGQAQANGDSTRLVTYYGGQARFWYRKSRWETTVKLDDWGPYDYYRDYNLTYPLQIVTDLSTGVTSRRTYDPVTRFGVLAKYRELDEFSPQADPDVFGRWGNEFEIDTYVRISL